jgi:hypothetical protein
MNRDKGARAGALQSSVRWLAYRWPFSSAGSLLLAALVPLVAGGLAGRNPYALAVGLVALLALMLLAIAGGIQARARMDMPVQWDSTRPVYARTAGCEQHIECGRAPLAPFFRLHADLGGTLKAGEHARFLVLQEVSSRDGQNLPMVLDFPVSGLLELTARLSVKDLFGLTRSRFGVDHQRSLIVQPAPFPEVKPTPVRAVQGDEETSRHTQSDEERYYMREYVPGDRFRDINWKSSSRLRELVTRISPVTQEKTQVVQVEFRHYIGGRRDSLDSVVHIDFIKSWLLTFLRRQKRDNPKYSFRVLTGRGVFELDSEDDIERFGQDLALLHGQGDPGSDVGRDDGGQVFLFSTPFDAMLPQALSFYRKAQVWVCRTVTPQAKVTGTVRVPFVSWVTGAKSPMFPGAWAIARRKETSAPVNVPAARKQELPLMVELA